jgi:hypothetical protein
VSKRNPDTVSSADTDGLEQPVGAVYADGEATILGIVAEAVSADLRAGRTTPTGRSKFRGKLTKYVRNLVTKGTATANTALGKAMQIGRNVAARVLQRTPAVSAQPPVVDAPTAPASAARTKLTVDELRATAPQSPRSARGVTVRTPGALIPQLHSMAPQLINAADGLYQQVVTQVLNSPLDSDAARLRLAQRILDQAATKGITGFVDKAGRKWSMVSYVEMATRTAAAQIAVEAHTALLAENGHDLVRVSVHENCSPMCAPFQGNLLSITGNTRNDGRAGYHQRIVCSLAEAKARGFLHPNCKHYVSLWVPGDSLPWSPEVKPENYEATQHLRYLERGLRAARNRGKVALDDKAAAKARAQIIAYRKRIADHVAAHPTVLRKPHRERIDGAI